MIKNIIFDLGGVIVPLNRMALIRSFDEMLGYKDFGQLVSDYRQGGYFSLFEVGQIDSATFRDKIRENISPNEDGSPRYVSDETIDAALNDWLIEIPQNKIDTLLACKEKYRLFMLSNTNPIGYKKCQYLFKDKGYEMTDFFEKIFLSFKMGVAKPDLEIFQKLIEEAEIIPEETLFIDDSSSNIQSGSEMGFNTLLFNTKEDLYAKVSESLKWE